MPRFSDLVRDSRLDTEFRNSTTIHTFPEAGDVGGWFVCEEQWESQKLLGTGKLGEVRLERCVTPGTKHGALRAVKRIDTQGSLCRPVDIDRELETLAKFSNSRVSKTAFQAFYIYLTHTTVSTMVRAVVRLVRSGKRDLRCHGILPSW